MAQLLFLYNPGIETLLNWSHWKQTLVADIQCKLNEDKEAPWGWQTIFCTFYRSVSQQNRPKSLTSLNSTLYWQSHAKTKPRPKTTPKSCLNHTKIMPKPHVCSTYCYRSGHWKNRIIFTLLSFFPASTISYSVELRLPNSLVEFWMSDFFLFFIIIII